MSDVNKLDDKQCPFDPDQYKAHVKVSYTIDNDIAAPVGSLPWALIQVYLGKVVGRSKWGVNEYIRLSAKNDSKTPVHIEKHDQQNFPYDWEPTPEDLMACDWELVKIKPKPVDCMLSFDLEVGQGTYNESDRLCGYLADDELEASGELGPFGTLTNLKNKTDITKFSYFVWDENAPGITLRVSADKDQVGVQKMKTLFAKDLTVTVGSEVYHLRSTNDITLAGKQQFEFVVLYDNDDSQKLGDLLKQNVGKTLSFCFNWK